MYICTADFLLQNSTIIKNKKNYIWTQIHIIKWYSDWNDKNATSPSRKATFAHTYKSRATILSQLFKHTHVGTENSIHFSQCTQMTDTKPDSMTRLIFDDKKLSTFIFFFHFCSDIRIIESVVQYHS